LPCAPTVRNSTEFSRMRYSLLGAPSLEAILRLRSPESTIHCLRKMSSKMDWASRLRGSRIWPSLSVMTALLRRCCTRNRKCCELIQQRPWLGKQDRLRGRTVTTRAFQAATSLPQPGFIPRSQSHDLTGMLEVSMSARFQVLTSAVRRGGHYP